MDTHYSNASNYISATDHDLFISKTIQREYQNKKQKLNTRYSKAVTNHIGDLKKSSYTGSLGPMDLSEIKKNVLYHNNKAHDFLIRYYNDKIGDFIQMDRLIKKLRDLSRDIDQLAKKRKDKLDVLVTEWTPKKNHPSVEKCLSEIHQPDRDICIEAHDLAAHRGNFTEIATANSEDFIKDGRKALIIDNTAIDDIEDLSP